MTWTPVSARPFVGRDEELRSLRDVRRDLSAGRGGIALIGGTAGIGKSRLLAEFLQTIGGVRRPLLIRVDCLEHGGVTFGPIRDIVAKLAASGGRRIDVVAAESLEQGSFFQAIEAIVRGAAEKRSIVVCIEDLHWADRSTLEFVAYWAARIASTRVAAFVTYRDDELETRPEDNALVAGISRVRAARAIALRPLDDASMLRMLAAGPRTALADARLFRNVVDRAGGNPFFGEELYKAALDTGSRVALPQSISASILLRFRTLAEGDRAIVSRAAVLGYRFDPEMLVQIFGFSRAAVALALREAQARLLVVEVAETVVRFRFRHALTHETIASQTLEFEARPLHARIARAFEDLPHASERIGEIAYHHWKARDADRAVPANEAAADAALAIHAYADAAMLNGRALDLARSPLEISRFSSRMGQVLTLRGDHALALEYYERALGLELGSGSYAEASLTIRRIAGRLGAVGRDAEAHTRLASFAREYGASLSAVDALLVGGWELLVNLGGGEPRGWRERLRAQDAAVRTNGPGAWGLSLLCVNADADLGDLAAWTQSVVRLRRHWDGGTVSERAMTLLQIAVTAAYASAGRAVVRSAIEEAGAFFERYGLFSLRRYLATADAFDRYLHGDMRGAVRAVYDVLGDGNDFNVLTNLVVFAVPLGIDLQDRELISIASDERLVERFRSVPQTHGAALIGGGLASRANAMGRQDDVRRILEHAVDGLETLLGTQMLLPFAARFVKTARARDRIGRLLAHVYPEDLSGSATRAMVAATFAAREGATETVTLAREAAGHYERLGWPIMRARALELAGDAAPARALLAACGVAASLREASGPEGDDGYGTAAGLTERERDIASAVAAGRANREIAADLNISVKTVEKHLSRIYARFGFRSRVQLARHVADGRSEVS